MVVVFVIRYAIRSAKSGHPAVGQSLDRLVQRWLWADVSVVARYYLSVLGFVPKYKKILMEPSFENITMFKAYRKLCYSFSGNRRAEQNIFL